MEKENPAMGKISSRMHHWLHWEKKPQGISSESCARPVLCLGRKTWLEQKSEVQEEVLWTEFTGGPQKTRIFVSSTPSPHHKADPLRGCSCDSMGEVNLTYGGHSVPPFPPDSPCGLVPRTQLNVAFTRWTTPYQVRPSGEYYLAHKC